VASVGDEQATPSLDTARSSWLAPTADGPSVADLGFLLKTPDGILAAQSLVGNKALQRLLRPPHTPPVAVSRDANSPTDPSANGTQAVAGNPGDTAEALNGGAGTVAYSYSKNPTSGGNFQFSDPDYNSLMATLTARMGTEEIGRCLPNLTLVLNGISVPQDGSPVNLPDDTAPVKTGTFTVVDNITLPTWTNVGAPGVQDAQKTEWARYTAAVAAHEDMHAGDDKAAYDPVGASLGQKKIGAAIDAVTAATTAANAQAGPRDTSSPPPTLNPAGTTKVP
jgi:hypothetical protein